MAPKGMVLTFLGVNSENWCGFLKPGLKMGYVMDFRGLV